MAKAVAKSKKAVAKTAAKSAAKSKSSARPKTAAPARKALKKAPAKPIAKVAKKAVVAKPAAEAVKAGKWVYTFGDGKAEGKAGLLLADLGLGAALGSVAFDRTVLLLLLGPVFDKVSGILRDF